MANITLTVNGKTYKTMVYNKFRRFLNKSIKLLLLINTKLLIYFES